MDKGSLTGLLRVLEKSAAEGEKFPSWSGINLRTKKGEKAVEVRTEKGEYEGQDRLNSGERCFPALGPSRHLTTNDPIKRRGQGREN